MSVKPGAHVQEKEFRPLLQVPCRHGLDEHSSMSTAEKKTEKSNQPLVCKDNYSLVLLTTRKMCSTHHDTELRTIVVQPRNIKTMHTYIE